MRLAGLNIEAGIVRASIINRFPGRTMFVRSAAFDLTGNSDEERMEALRSILVNLKEEDSVRGVVFGVGITFFTHNYISLPLVKRPDIMHALGFELEKHLPLPPEEYLFDFTTVSRSSERSNLLVLAALRCKLEWISKACQEAGMVLLGIRSAAMESMNEFTSENEADGVHFIYRGHDATAVFGLKDTAPVEMKVLRKGMSSSEAGLNVFLERYTKGAFAAAEPNSVPPANNEAAELDYDIPQILARSAFRKRRFDMQFAPGAGGSAVPLWNQQAPQVMAVLCITLLLLTSAVSYYKDISALHRLDAEILEVKEQSDPLMDVREELLSINSRKKRLNNFLSIRSMRTKALRELSIRLPSSAWLTSLSIDEEGKIQLQGYAARASDIIRPLDSSGLFKNVEFASPVTISDGRERFSIRMEIEQ